MKGRYLFFALTVTFQVESIVLFAPYSNKWWWCVCCFFVFLISGLLISLTDIKNNAIRDIGWGLLWGSLFALFLTIVVITTATLTFKFDLPNQS